MVIYTLNVTVLKCDLNYVVFTLLKLLHHSLIEFSLIQSFRKDKEYGTFVEILSLLKDISILSD